MQNTPQLPIGLFGGTFDPIHDVMINRSPTYLIPDAVEAYIIKERKPIFTRLLQQYKPVHWYQQLQQAMQIDRMIKGIEPGNVWDSLQNFGLKLLA